ncbi:MAG: WYL domain-containing protein [Nakamurella sp.]
MRFDYLPAGANAAADHPAGPRRAQPHHLVARGGRWYVIAWDLDRDDWRTFRADRMALHSPNGPRFTPRELPGGDVAAYVASQFRGGQPGGDWACRGSAVIEVAPNQLTPYLDEGTTQILDGDRVRIQLGAWCWLALAATFARLDTELTSVRPAELREAFGVLADRALGAATDDRGFDEDAPVRSGRGSPRTPS